MNNHLLKYKKQIQELNPLEDSRFVYDSERWADLDTEAQSVLSEFADKMIARKDIVNAFEKYFEEKVNYLFPFTMTMVWGFGDTGYGTYRTNQYLSTNENMILIESALHHLKNENRKQAYKSLMKIKGLSVSYVSKLLYFGTRALKSEDYALIFDIRVARAFINLVHHEEVSSFLKVTPSTKYKDYESYNKSLHTWAKELQVEAECIEWFLFSGDF